MRKIILGIMVIGALLIIAGCGEAAVPDSSSPAAPAATPTADASQQQSNLNQAAANNAQKLRAHNPLPTGFTYSSELENLSTYFKRMNDPCHTSWVTVYQQGQAIFHHEIWGKVTSTESRLTPPQQIVNGAGDSGTGYYAFQNQYVMDSPELDGSYGQSEQGVFFFLNDSGACGQGNRGTMVVVGGPTTWIETDKPVFIPNATQSLQILDNHGKVR